jgi:hypothetical protein
VIGVARLHGARLCLCRRSTTTIKRSGDLNQAIEFDPLDGFGGRGAAYNLKGEQDRAMADFD